jgi:hypothetical protein
VTDLLLIGAGFSRNWGGWLANEAFEYLLGCAEVAGAVRDKLWKAHLDGGGFEGALSDLQASDDAEARRALEAALYGMFAAMNGAFARSPAFTQELVDFLARFHAVFTLNQDLLLELRYLQQVPVERWGGSCRSPGVVPDPTDYALGSPHARVHRPTPAETFRVDPRTQPYFKLHGSSSWRAEDGSRLLIMGGGKASSIGRSPLLSWYHRMLGEYLSRPDVRLMVIGYSFGDLHINDAISAALRRGELRLFIVDPLGVNVLDKGNPRAAIPDPKSKTMLEAYAPYIIGASRRSLTTTFQDDEVERAKLMRFFERA